MRVLNRWKHHSQLSTHIGWLERFPAGRRNSADGRMVLDFIGQMIKDTNIISSNDVGAIAFITDH